MVQARKEHMALEAPEPDAVEIPPGVPSLETFKSLSRARNQAHVNHSTDRCDWFYGEVNLFHERSYFPWSIFKEPSSEYWGEPIYTSESLAVEHAKRFGANVQQGWYCEAPDLHWFLIFDDLDKAFAYMHFYLYEFSL